MKLVLCGQDITIVKAGQYGEDFFCNVYKDDFISRYIRYIPPLIALSFDDWYKKIVDADVVIIFDTYYKRGMFQQIHKLNKNIRIIFYCWNSVKTIEERFDFDRLRKKDYVEFWSYNLEDCKKYHLFYNKQFWNKDLIEDPYITIENDVCFIGAKDKRIKELNEVREIFKAKNIKPYLYLTESTNVDDDKNDSKRFLPYPQYINEIAVKSKAILDLVTPDNYGLTLRPLEAMFLKRKLITNYENIYQYDFYRKNNIFILGKDDVNQLNDFINTPYESIPEDIINSYNYDQWLNRFDQKEDALV